MNARTNRWVIAAAIAALILGAVLSRVIEPGVRVEKVMLATNTPAIRLFPAMPGPHPIALLAHGATGSKEMFSICKVALCHCRIHPQMLRFPL